MFARGSVMEMAMSACSTACWKTRGRMSGALFSFILLFCTIHATPGGQGRRAEREGILSPLPHRVGLATDSPCAGRVRPESGKPHSGAPRAAGPVSPAVVARNLPRREQGARVMTEYLVLIITTALVNNVVLVKFLGLCPFMGVSKRLDSALGMGLATGFVIVLAAAVSWILETWLLAPLGLSYLRIMTFILVIAATVQFVELVVRKLAPDLYQMLGIYLPLITTNCAVLGLPLINVQEGHSFVKTVVYDFGASVGFTLALVMFADLRERLALAKVPNAFTGAPIAFVLAS